MSSTDMPVKTESTVSERSAEDVLDDLDDFLENVEDEGDPDVQSLVSSASTKTVSYSHQLKTACSKCKSAASPVICSAKLNHRSCLKDILSCMSHLCLAEERDADEDTAAHIAARENRLETLQLLFQYDRTILESKDHKGASPLHTSAEHGQEDCVRWILRNGGSVYQRDFDGASAVHYAATSGHLKVLKELLPLGSSAAREQTYNGETPLYFAAQEGKLNCVQWMVESGLGDPNQPGNDGMGPMHVAVQSGHLQTSKWLIESGHCKVTSKTLDGGTAVHFAAAKGHTAILEWMFKSQLADGTERDEFGTTPVHDAAEEGQLECLRVFYEHGIDLNMQDLDSDSEEDEQEDSEVQERKETKKIEPAPDRQASKKLPSPSTLFATVGKPEFLDRSEHFDWDRHIKVFEKDDEDENVHISGGYAAIAPPSELHESSGTVDRPPKSYAKAESSDVGDSIEVGLGLKRQRENKTAIKNHSEPSLIEDSGPDSKKKKGEWYRDKEKRKRDIGQSSRAKSYVEEEKRVLRQGYNVDQQLS